GFDPSDPGDADGDADGDGITNRREYVFGTDPHDPSSNLDSLDAPLDLYTSLAKPSAQPAE
ncbi:MAG: hypothetical protein R3F11_33120, partial [Verrucomicrobiales bacterium]